VADDSLAIAATGNQCTVQRSAPGDAHQQWQLIYYAEMNAVALLIEPSPGKVRSLYSKSGEKWPVLVDFEWDDSHFWKVPPMDGHQGIALRRDMGWSLTITGPGPWKAGDTVEIWDWHNQNNQKWHAKRIW
jgi:hypothetical protein